MSSLKSALQSPGSLMQQLLLACAAAIRKNDPNLFVVPKTMQYALAIQTMVQTARDGDELMAIIDGYLFAIAKNQRLGNVPLSDVQDMINDRFKLIKETIDHAESLRILPTAANQGALQ